MKVLKSHQIDDLLKPLLRKGKAVALTGAGISAESGVPTFRGRGGLWEKYDPEIFANAQGLLSTFRLKPVEIVDFLTDLYSVLLKAKPNPAHFALAQMQNKGILDCVITQNIDDLDSLAGLDNVYELHGNAFRLRCQRCLRKINLNREKLAALIKEMKNCRNSKWKFLKLFSQFFPKCSCKDRFRIDIVLFGEMLEQDVLSKAYQAVKNCSSLFLIGTSGVVYPAAGLPFIAKQNGAKIIEINDNPSELSFISDYQILGKAARILPLLIKDL